MLTFTHFQPVSISSHDKGEKNVFTLHLCHFLLIVHFEFKIS